MKSVSIYTTLSIVIISFVVGLSLGYFITPEYKTNMYSKNMDLGLADRTYDLRYINAMIAHHRGAVLLATQLRESTQREELKSLSAEILKNEPVTIADLYKMKKDWYSDVRPVRDPVVSNLGTYDENFDLRFLNAIIAHHNEGLLMTKDAKTKSSRTEILNNAYAVENFFNNGLTALKTLRNSWYNI